MSRSKYKPISCSFYDVLEAVATLRKKVHIRYREDGQEKEMRDFIQDLFIREHAEYLRTSDGAEIRLDQLIQVDTFKLVDFC